MSGLWHDVVYGLRSLLRKPTFSLAALAALMLGIGTNTAIFTLLDAVFLSPLPLPGIERLTAVFRTIRTETGDYAGELSLSYDNYVDYRERNESFEDLALYQWSRMILQGNGEPQRVIGMYVSDNYFDLLALEPSRGRLFQPADGGAASPPVAVLSHSAWQRLFGAAPGVIGEKLTLNGESMTVVGVAPEGFGGTTLRARVDVFVPIHSFERLSPYRDWFKNRGASLFVGLGRLREGVTVEQASTEMQALAGRLAEEYPKILDGLGAKALPLAMSTIPIGDRERYQGYGIRLLVVLAILLIACLSVANLLFVRGVERSRELALRQALGADRGRLLRQLLTENLMLFLAGGIASLLVAKFFLELLWAFRPPEIAATAVDLTLDARVLGLALSTTLLLGLLFGVWPALRAARTDLVANLKESEALGAAREGHVLMKPRSLAVVLQVALALVALIGAGLLLRSLSRMLEIDLGFASDRLAVLSVAPGEQGYPPEQALGYYQRLLERARSLPGVKAAGFSQNRLLRGAIVRRQIFLPGEDRAQEILGADFHRVNVVGPGFFEAVEIPLLAGRDFRDHEGETQRIAIVNETMARHLWGDREPIGQRFHFDYPDQPQVEVIGVVADVKYRQIREDKQFFVYLPLAQNYTPSMTLHVRTAEDPAAILESLRRGARELDASLALSDVATMSSFVREALWMERASTTLLGLFAALALVLALVGIYGLLAYSVSCRQRELGILIALGARRGHVLRSILGEALQVAGAGILLGLAAAAVLLKPIMASQLYGVSALDPGTYATWSAILFVFALLGSAIPAWHAARTDPNETLRNE